jgi:signal transduction histidine kinase
LVLVVIKIIYLHRERQRKFIVDVEKLKSDFEKNILKARLEIQEQTFQAISREIHDNITLSLTLAKLNLNTFDFRHSDKSVYKINSSIDLVSKAIGDLTDISKSMNSDIIVHQGLITALEQEIGKLKKLNSFDVTYVISGEPVYMDAQRELFIFRIVQEAFNNILKHAEPKTVRLKLYYGTTQLKVTVSDDGKGFEFESADSVKRNFSSGLRNIHKRTELLNGKCFIKSAPASGTTINILIPF